MPFLALAWSVCIAATEPAAESAPGGSLPGLIVPLLVVASALAALWWVLRRQGGHGSASGPVRIVQIMAVGTRERILVVDHDTQRFMLGVTPSGISLLAHLGSKDAAKNPASASFSPNEHVAPTPD